LNWRLSIGIAAACLGLAPPSAALAEPPRVYLEWQRPLGSTCPPREVLERGVERALGRKVFGSSPTAAELTIVGTVEDSADGALVRLTARRRNGEVRGSRELRADPGACAALSEDLSLVLTLLVEGEAAASSAAGPIPLRIELGLGGAFLLNMLPRGSFGVGAALALDLGSQLQVRADALYWLPLEVETGSGIRARLQAGSLALRICPRLARVGSAQLRACAGAQLGTLINSQLEPEGPETQVRLLAQGLVELRAGLHVWQTARLELAGGPLMALNRTRIFAVQSDGTRVQLYRSPFLGLILSLALII
jgi:hypothetical protein